MPHTETGLFAEDFHKPFVKKEFERRDLGPKDVDIEIKYAGICGSDVHKYRGEWGPCDFEGPGLCPGHEIVGIIRAVGSEVTKFKVGDKAGIGCLVDSCRDCESCQDGYEQLCEHGGVLTYNGRYKYKHHPEIGGKTYGGYSTGYVCDEAFVLHVPDSLDFAAAAPLLCAGITTYSPLRYFGLEKGMRYAVAGLGGLGHMAVKFGVAMGAHVTVLSRGTAKKDDALALGAHEYVDVKNEEEMKNATATFDFILDTVSAKHDLAAYLALLRNNGKMILVGGVPEPLDLRSFSLLRGRKTLAGSIIGGIAETQEMLNFCAEHNVLPQTELISADYVDEAYKRMHESDVRYRFVIDIATLKDSAAASSI